MVEEYREEVLEDKRIRVLEYKKIGIELLKLQKLGVYLLLTLLSSLHFPFPLLLSSFPISSFPSLPLLSYFLLP